MGGFFNSLNGDGLKPLTIIGGSGKIKRHAADFYPTPSEATEALLMAFPNLFVNQHIWEPACGIGHMSRVLETRNTVTSSDLHDRGYGIGGTNFLTAPAPPGITAIVTNPPFNISAEFIRRARVEGVPFALFLKSTYWHSKKRRDLFVSSGPMAVCPLTWRPVCAEEQGKSPTLDFLWTVWDKTPVSQCAFIPVPKPSKQL